MDSPSAKPISERAAEFAKTVLDALYLDMADKGTPLPENVREDLSLVVELSFNRGYQEACTEILEAGLRFRPPTAPV